MSVEGLVEKKNVEFFLLSFVNPKSCDVNPSLTFEQTVRVRMDQFYSYVDIKASS